MHMSLARRRHRADEYLLVTTLVTSPSDAEKVIATPKSALECQQLLEALQQAVHENVDNLVTLVFVIFWLRVMTNVTQRLISNHQEGRLLEAVAE